MGPAAAQADQHVDLVAPVVVDDGFGHVGGFAVDPHAVRLVAAGAEDGAAQGEDTGEHVAIQAHGSDLHQAPEAVPESDHLHPVVTLGTLADGPNCSVQAGAVAAGRQYTYPFGHYFLFLEQQNQFVTR